MVGLLTSHRTTSSSSSRPPSKERRNEEAVYLRGGADRRLALLALRPLTATLYRAREAMTSERVVSIIIGDSAAARPPREVVRVGLTAAVAAVLSTYRSNSPDMVLDHPLWLSCARTVTEAIHADETHVFGEPQRGRLARLLGCSKPLDLDTLETYAARLASEPEAPEWRLVHWKRRGLLVAVGVAEPWYRVGGPAPYHDSYTMRVFLAPLSTADVVARMRLRIEEAGGFLGQIADVGGATPA